MSREVVAILARARNGTIGRDGTLPWRLPADLKRFKALTLGAPMIMGRKTFESFPAPLPGRRHIVLTRDKAWHAPGAEVAHSAEDALALAGEGRVSVIGGAEIYRLMLPYLTRIELTEVYEDVTGDTAMPPFGPEWREVAREEHEAFAFVTLSPSPLRGEGRGEGADPGDHTSQTRPLSPTLSPAGRGSSIPILDHRDPLPAHLRGAVFALGNFDGFHLGHQAVVGAAVDLARAQNRPAIVATFDPHPMRMFRPDAAPFRLTTLAQRAELFAAAGADAMLVFHFDSALAALTAEEFAALLAGPLGAAGVVTGQDYTFGKGRTGTTALLAQLGTRAGFVTRTIDPVCDDDGPISSSRIRTALQAGDCETAARLMTRPFAIRGPVVHGAKLGRSIGYPTANVEMGNYLRPKYGIYAVTARLADGTVINGAANLGIRPSFEPPIELLETYLFDWSGDLYGQDVEIALHHYLRPEAKFDTLEALIAQMDADCAQARELLA